MSETTNDAIRRKLLTAATLATELWSGKAGKPKVQELGNNATSCTIPGFTVTHDPDRGEVTVSGGGERVTFKKDEASVLLDALRNL